jgi:hypothetical protein
VAAAAQPPELVPAPIVEGHSAGQTGPPRLAVANSVVPGKVNEQLGASAHAKLRSQQVAVIGQRVEQKALIAAKK